MSSRGIFSESAEGGVRLEIFFGGTNEVLEMSKSMQLISGKSCAMKRKKELKCCKDKICDRYRRSMAGRQRTKFLVRNVFSLEQGR